MDGVEIIIGGGQNIILQRVIHSIEIQTECILTIIFIDQKTQNFGEGSVEDKQFHAKRLYSTQNDLLQLRSYTFFTTTCTVYEFVARNCACCFHSRQLTRTDANSCNATHLISRWGLRVLSLIKNNGLTFKVRLGLIYLHVDDRSQYLEE